MADPARTLPDFLGLTAGDGELYAASRAARVAVLPLPYEGTVSWGGGAAEGPRALLEASCQMETWDELLACEPARAGIETRPAPELPDDPAGAVGAACEAAREILAEEKLPLAIGGEHSLSAGVYRALAEACGPIGVVQLDAHADLRIAYEGTPHSHACVMARIREETGAVLQLGIRSLSRAEAVRVRDEELAVRFMHELRAGQVNLEADLARLPEKIFLTLDVDCLDTGLVRATGTPDPGGFTWDEANDLLARIFEAKTVVGMDIMELCGGDPASAFAAARLAQRMIGLRFPNA
jgi:agmatinase